MSYYKRLPLEFKTGTFVMPLIEEKIGIGVAGIYHDKRCARCVNIVLIARNVSPTAHKTATFATPFYNRGRPGIENNMVSLTFPWIKSSEVGFSECRIKVRHDGELLTVKL
jgi:hypothetical protein